MNPATALAVILAGAALVMIRHGSTRVRAAGSLIAGAVAMIGLSKLCDLLAGSHVGFDQWLYRDRLAGANGLTPNRMAPNTALNVALIGLALMGLRWEPRRRDRASQYIALLPLGLSLLAVLGYALDVRALYGVGAFIPMALNTAVGLFLLSLAVLFAHPTDRISRVFVADDVGGALARRMLPGAVLVPALLAWARMHAHRAGWFEFEPGVSVMVFVCIVVLSVFTWFTADRLSRVDQARRGALDRLKEAHDELEARVEQRTAALRDSEGRYRLLFASNPHPMWVYDRATLHFLAVNEAAVALYGYSTEEFLQMTIKDIRPPEDVPALVDDLAKPGTGLTLRRERRHRRKDGTVLAVEVSSHTLMFDGHDAALVLAQDVTRHKQLQAQFQQAQKMEAVGRLAGGVAHDFNNLLTAILGQTHLMRTRPDLQASIAEEVAEIDKAATRAAGLTRQLLAFSRQQVLQPQVLDLNHVIADMEKMLGRLIGEHIRIVVAPAADLGAVRADPGQIEQVLMNLVVNARDAMPAGGKIILETGNATLDEGYAQGRIDLEPGRYVMLAVSDTGSGMTPETRARIFEPFFTTKEVGRGTGLGLSTVHGIVKQSGGHVEVYTELGQGTTFKIYLPLAQEPSRPAEANAPVVRQLGGSETIVVVEDEDTIRVLMRRVLTGNGYTVLEASDGSEAISLCERQQRIDLLITDVVMPLMNGPDMVRRVCAARPGVRVLFISGYTDQALIHQGLKTPGATFLQKPFTPDTLLAKIREILDTPLARAA
jgi:PAS domain S-box-containing protein